MRRVVLLLPLLLGGCSCQPESARAPVEPAAPAEVSEAGAEAAADDAGPEPDAPAAAVEQSAVAPGAVDESTTIHSYVYTLLGTDRAKSDAYWSGGVTSSRADDQVLRELPDLRSLRVKTKAPVALDSAQPSRLREVPVQIRAMTREGTLNFQGWYRLQPRADGSGWEITGASLQPVVR